MPVVLSAIASCALNVAHSGHQTAPYQTTGTRAVSLTGDAAAAEARRRVVGSVDDVESERWRQR